MDIGAVLRLENRMQRTLELLTRIRHVIRMHGQCDFTICMSRMQFERVLTSAHNVCEKPVSKLAVQQQTHPCVGLVQLVDQYQDSAYSPELSRCLFDLIGYLLDLFL